MSGRITFSPVGGGQCCSGKPPAENYPNGTIWTCDDCGKEWVVVIGAQYNEPYSAWRDASKPTSSGETR